VLSHLHVVVYLARYFVDIVNSKIYIMNKEEAKNEESKKFLRFRAGPKPPLPRSRHRQNCGSALWPVRSC